jgi:hypothetical protein
VCGRIQASAGEAVAWMVSESAATQFSVIIFELTAIVCSDESRRQLGRQSR